MKLRFSWDDRKDRENRRKHGVSFEEAATIFRNMPFDVFYDPDHSHEEERFVAVGFSDRQRMLVVVHGENRDGSEIRIISARKASKKETRTLFGGGRS